MKFLKKYNESFSKEYYDDIFLDLTDDGFRVSTRSNEDGFRISEQSRGSIKIEKYDKSYFSINQIIDYVLSASDYSLSQGYFLSEIDLQTSYGWYSLYHNSIVEAGKGKFVSKLWNADVIYINLNFRMNLK